MGGLLIAAVSGALFGVGLIVSGMVRPDVVLGFLDPLGAWDPSLALVMIGGLAAAVPGYAWVRRRWHRAEAAAPSSSVDMPLVAGAALFGIGWGLAGYCPGPIMISVAAGQVPALWVAGGMAAGMAAARMLKR